MKGARKNPKTHTSMASIKHSKNQDQARKQEQQNSSVASPTSCRSSSKIFSLSRSLTFTLPSSPLNKPY